MCSSDPPECPHPRTQSPVCSALQERPGLLPELFHCIALHSLWEAMPGPIRAMATSCATIVLLSHVALVQALSGTSILDLQTRRGVPHSPSSAVIVASTLSQHPLRLRGGKEHQSSLAEFQLNEDSQAKKVDICGSWDGWKERLPLKKKGDGWKQSHILPIGVHQYKFIIDDETWKCSDNLPQAPGPEGFMNNVMEVSDPSVKKALLVTKEELKSALRKEVRTKRLASIQARMERLQNRVHSFTSDEEGLSSREASLSRQERERGLSPARAAAKADYASDFDSATEEHEAPDPRYQKQVPPITKMGRGPSADDHKWEPVKGQKLGSKRGRGFKKFVKRVAIAAVLAGAGFVAKEQFDQLQAKEAAAKEAAAKAKGKGRGWR